VRVDVFVGPTLEAGKVRDLISDAVIHPPIAHGDLFRLAPRCGDVVVIIDGYYHHHPPVRHKEILATLAEGVTVVGCSSMGALRAAELNRYGMIGNGAVFEMYRNGAVESDEEVAVAHGDPPEYRKFSEPMVNIRTVLTLAERDGVVTNAESSALLSHAAAVAYAQRTWRAIEQRLHHNSPQHVPALERLKSYLAAKPVETDIKKADATDTLRRLDVLLAAAAPGSVEWAASSAWRSQHLYLWKATFNGQEKNEISVSDGAVLRYQQLYHKDFPKLWRAFALRKIVASAVGEPIGERTEKSAVLDIAARHGIGRRALTAQQTEEWLTESERIELTSDEATIRLLTRSYRPRKGLYDLVTAFPHLVTDADARRAVAESRVVNAEVAAWQVGQEIEHIRGPVLTQHLARTWGVSSADHRSIQAHARDRGFARIEEAIAAARQFFLRERILRAPVPQDRSQSRVG
jgi:hypothetical protein